MPAKRRPQINFQVNEPMKVLYEEAKACGHWVTRFCAAGFLLMVVDPIARKRAISRLREWEARYGDASPDQIRVFVQEVEDAMQGGVRESRPVRKAPPSRKKAKRARSA